MERLTKVQFDELVKITKEQSRKTLGTIPGIDTSKMKTDEEVRERLLDELPEDLHPVEYIRSEE